jgi:hypothetical protein
MWSGLIDKFIIEFVNIILSVTLTIFLLSQVSYFLVILFIFLLLAGQAI